MDFMGSRVAKTSSVARVLSVARVVRVSSVAMSSRITLNHIGGRGGDAHKMSGMEGGENWSKLCSLGGSWVSTLGRWDVVNPVWPSYMCNCSQKEMRVIVDNCRQINAANYAIFNNKCNNNFFLIKVYNIQYTILTNKERRSKTKIKGTDKKQLL